MKKALPFHRMERSLRLGNPSKKILRGEHKSVELRAKRRKGARARKPKRITKRELKRFLKLNKKSLSIARYYRVSESTIKRKVREYGLAGLRKLGRKPFVKRPKFPKPVKEWFPTRKYIDELNKVYRFINIAYPPFKYINPKTLVCSNRKGNPKGKFTTVGAYFIVEQSDVYFVNYARIRYSEKPANFDEIYAWAKENMLDILSEQYRRASFVIERIIAFTFLLPEKKPKKIRMEVKTT